MGPDHLPGDVTLPLSFQAYDCLWGCLETLAIEADEDDVQRGLGVTRGELEDWAGRLLNSLLAQRAPYHVTIPACYLDIAPRLYAACFEMVSESATHTIAGRERWELEAGEQELLEALRAAGVDRS